jgi:hypothetical protein
VSTSEIQSGLRRATNVLGLIFVQGTACKVAANHSPTPLKSKNDGAALSGGAVLALVDPKPTLLPASQAGLLCCRCRA